MKKAFQFAYTFVFGIYAGYILVKTKSIFSAIFLHSMCNYFGFPNVQLLWADENRISKFHQNIIRAAYLFGILLAFILINPIFNLINNNF